MMNSGFIKPAPKNQGLAAMALPQSSAGELPKDYYFTSTQRTDLEALHCPPDISLDTSFVDPVAHPTEWRSYQPRSTTPAASSSQSSYSVQSDSPPSPETDGAEGAWMQMMLNPGSISLDSDELASNPKTTARSEDLLGVLWHDLLNEAHETSLIAEASTSATASSSSESSQTRALFEEHLTEEPEDIADAPSQEQMSRLFPLPPANLHHRSSQRLHPVRSSSLIPTSTAPRYLPQVPHRRHSNAYVTTGQLPAPAPLNISAGKRRPTPLNLAQSNNLLPLPNAERAPKSAPPGPALSPMWQEQDMFLRQAGDHRRTSGASSAYHWSQFDSASFASPRPNSYNSWMSGRTPSEISTPRSIHEDDSYPSYPAQTMQSLQAAHDTPKIDLAAVQQFYPRTSSHNSLHLSQHGQMWMGDEGEDDERSGCVQWGMAL